MPTRICHRRRTAGPRAYTALPEDHVRREAGKMVADGVEDPAWKFSCWWEEIKRWRRLLELQAMFLAARPWEMSARLFWVTRSQQSDEETKDNQRAGVMGSQATSGATALTKRGRRGQWTVETKRQVLGKWTEVGAKRRWRRPEENTPCVYGYSDQRAMYTDNQV
jgi:hypothetical protein